MAVDIVSDVVGIVGSATIAASIYFAQRMAARSSATLEMLRELHSREISEARSRARKHVIDSVASGREEWSNSPIDAETGLSPAESLFVLSRFFTRLQVIRRAKMISDTRLLVLFGPAFGYWWGLTYERQMDRTDSFRTRADLKDLYDFFYRRAVSEHRTEQWAEWVDEGRDERRAAEEGKHSLL
jgi:hypothetical protein